MGTSYASLTRFKIRPIGVGEFILDPELEMDVEPGKSYDLSKIHELSCRSSSG